METQSAGAVDGFTSVTRKGGRRAKKRQAEKPSAAGEDEDAGRMDTEEARPAKRPVFPPLSRDGRMEEEGFRSAWGTWKVSEKAS